MEKTDTRSGATQHRRAHRRGSGRDRVLDAYISLLREGGVSATTLDEIAARADISKGGLLHHFHSKEDLANALLERLKEESSQNLQKCESSIAHPVLSYLRSSMVAHDEYSETLLAAAKIAGTGSSAVDKAVSEVIDARWEALSQWTGDPVVARLLQLMSDGLYLHALMGYMPRQVDVNALKLAREAFSDEGD